ncbi:MAG: hypothetical protein ACYC4Q_09040 [Victivallaceae bacterium]
MKTFKIGHMALIIVVVCVSAGVFIFKEKSNFSAITDYNSLDLIQVGNKLAACELKTCTGEIKYIEILYIPKNVSMGLACGKECITTRYWSKTRISTTRNSELDRNSFNFPFCNILRAVTVTKAKYARDYRWVINFYGRDNQLVMEIYGAKSGDVLVDDSIAVHLDDKISNWLYSFFGDVAL